MGNPARISGYLDMVPQVHPAAKPGLPAAPSATGARLVDIPNFSDMRGDLGVLEWGPHLPFKVKRLFYTYNVPGSEVRGAHAHKTCHQFLVAVAGSLHVVVDNGTLREEVVLDSPRKGLYLPAGVWGTQYRHAPETVCLVLASHRYDAADYIRDYDDYLQWRRRRK
jgi:UDP-2-acetamido-3-amino-2,3-dideoxy-glucuronate N-acetyltransferase